MEIQEFVRKPFPVKAVEVNFQNAYEVAEWCRGRVELKKTRLMGGAGKGEMDLPTVVFQGTGDNRDKEFTAGLGDWVVELRGNFRVFKKAQFKATFEPVKPILHEITDKFPDAVRIEQVAGQKYEPEIDDETHEDDEITCNNPDCGPCRSGDADQEREDALHKAGRL
jgi:hypothetical protein